MGDSSAKDTLLVGNDVLHITDTPAIVHRARSPDDLVRRFSDAVASSREHHRPEELGRAGQHLRGGRALPHHLQYR